MVDIRHNFRQIESKGSTLFQLLVVNEPVISIGRPQSNGDIRGASMIGFAFWDCG